MDNEELIAIMVEHGWKESKTPEEEPEFTKGAQRIWRIRYPIGVSTFGTYWKYTSESFDGSSTGRTSKVITPDEMIKL